MILPSYIISVITVTSIGEGKILPSTGQARFKTSFLAVVMKPFKGEVVDGKVVNVNKVSVSPGELKHLFVKVPSYSSCLTLVQMGFFAMVGPLQVFVSSHVSREFSHLFSLPIAGISTLAMS